MAEHVERRTKEKDGKNQKQSPRNKNRLDCAHGVVRCEPNWEESDNAMLGGGALA